MESDWGSDRDRWRQTRGDGDRLGEMGLWGQIGGDERIMEADGGDEGSRGTIGAGWGRSEASTCSWQGPCAGRCALPAVRAGGPEARAAREPCRRSSGAAAGSTPALSAPRPRPGSPTPAPRSSPRRRAGVTVQPAGSGSSRAGPAGHAQCGGAAAAGGAGRAVRTAGASLPRRHPCPRDLTAGSEVSARGQGPHPGCREGMGGACPSPAPRRHVGAPVGGRGVQALLRAPLRPADPGPAEPRFSGLRCAPVPEQALDGPAPPPTYSPGGAGPGRGWQGGGPGPAGTASPRAAPQPARLPCAVGADRAPSRDAAAPGGDTSSEDPGWAGVVGRRVTLERACVARSAASPLPVPG